MATPVRDADPSGEDTDPGVAATVHLLHRRRAWAWTLCGSLIGAVVFLVVGANFWGDATGAAGAVSTVVAVLLLLLVVVGLVMVIAESVQLRRRHASVRAHAASMTSHHPVLAHPFRTPRHRVSHVFVWILLLAWVGLSVSLIPDQVNALGYLAGTGRTVSFLPQSYEQVCTRHGCHDVTHGTLLTHPPVTATWPGAPPLGQAFPVRQPVWNGWGSPNLMNGAQAGGVLVEILFIDVPAIGVIVGLVFMIRRRLRARRT